MPIGPKRSGSPDSMMQYTYLPRLAVAAAAVGRPAWTTGSDTRRSTGRAALIGARAELPDPLGLPLAFAVRPFLPFFAPAFAPACFNAGTRPRGRSPF